MSQAESFDPEKVERYDDYNGELDSYTRIYVSASDYDKLLELYKKAIGDHSNEPAQ